MLTESLAANSFRGLGSPLSAPLALGLPTLSSAPTAGEQHHTGSTHIEMPWMGSLPLQDRLPCWPSMSFPLYLQCVYLHLYPGLTRVRVPLLDELRKRGPGRSQQPLSAETPQLYLLQQLSSVQNFFFSVCPCETLVPRILSISEVRGNISAICFFFPKRMSILSAPPPAQSKLEE